LWHQVGRAFIQTDNLDWKWADAIFKTAKLPKNFFVLNYSLLDSKLVSLKNEAIFFNLKGGVPESLQIGSPLKQ